MVHTSLQKAIIRWAIRYRFQTRFLKSVTTQSVKLLIVLQMTE